MIASKEENSGMWEGGAGTLETSKQQYRSRSVIGRVRVIFHTLYLFYNTLLKLHLHNI